MAPQLWRSFESDLLKSRNVSKKPVSYIFTKLSNRAALMPNQYSIFFGYRSNVFSTLTDFQHQDVMQDCSLWFVV